MTRTANNAASFVNGDDEMSKRIRGFDWASTAVGDFTEWPQVLKTAVQIILESRYPMFVWWGPNLINFYNDAYISMLGKRHPQALGQPAAKVWEDIWPTVGEQARTVMEEGRSSWSEEMLLLMERNDYLEETYFTYSYSPLKKDNGEIGGLFCAVTEDTQQVLSQRSLRTLHELAEHTSQTKNPWEICEAAALALSENTADIPFALLYKLDAADTAARLAGVSGMKSGSALAPLAIIPGDKNALWPLCETEGGACEMQLEILPQDLRKEVPTGAWAIAPAYVVILPLRKSTEERPIGFLIAGVSPVRRLNEAYRAFFDLVASHIATAMANAMAHAEDRQRAEALAELDRAKTQFFTNVSHEFRTPLTLLLGPIEQMLNGNGDLPEPTGDSLRLVHRNAMRLLRLVNTMLDFSRIAEDRMKANFEAVDLAEFTAELAGNFRSICEQAGLTLTVRATPLNQAVYVDRELWEKIVLNLLSNAFKFTLQGGITVAVDAAEEGARLIISDTGVGIADNEKTKIFERFHRVNDSRGRTYEGSGIGLALIKELILLHGGTITVDSEINKGSCFIVTIPFGKAHLQSKWLSHKPTVQHKTIAPQFTEEAARWFDEDTRRDETGEIAHAEDNSPLQRPHVLWADDNADMRHYVARILGEQFEVESVADGEAAWNAACARPPDVIVSDVMMPKLDGFGLLKKIRQDSRLRDTPVIFLSARAGEGERIDGMLGGATDYLSKPFSARELIARVQANTEIVRLRRDREQYNVEQENLFRAMANGAPAILWTTIPGGICTFLSQGWYDLTGQTPEVALDFGWLDAIHPDDREHAAQIFRNAEEKREPFTIDYRVCCRDGKYRWAADTGHPRFADDGEFLGYIGSVVDVHQRRTAEDELREADRRKDEFLATLAHELRNPLAPIRTGLELIKRNKTDSDSVEATCTTMQRQINQLITLVNDLMDVSRITRGRLPLNKCLVELGDVIHSAVEATQEQFNNAGHQLLISVPDYPLPIDGDPNRLAQVISNLLSNAAKYTPDGGEIQLEVLENNGWVVLRIKDNGIGIPVDMQQRIFDMFAQVDNPLEKHFSGLGIGLTLVKSLLELHGGGIDVESKGISHGSEFIVKLPLARESRQRENHGSAADSDPINASPTRRRVLVVDDNRDAADTLKLLIQMLGHDTHVAYNGIEAIDLANHHRPEFIILDLGMPGMDGYETGERIRQLPWSDNTLLVALTGWGQKEVQQRTKAIGFDYHLVKPADPAEIRQILNSPIKNAAPAPVEQ